MKKKKRGIEDPHVFIPLNETIMEDSHKSILMKHLKEMIIDVRDDRKDIDGLMQDMKTILISMSKLKKYYAEKS